VNIYDMFMAPLEKRVLAGIRVKIIPRAFGNVLEIGYGTGANFPYYKASSVKKLYALDMKVSNSHKIKTVIPVQFYQGRAENLPFPDETFDTIVETLVFCSVEDLTKSVREVLRVLKPGGIFIYIDHVLPEEKSLASLFKAVNIFWPRIAGGCSLTRETHKIIEASGLIPEETGRSGANIFRWGIGRKA